MNMCIYCMNTGYVRHGTDQVPCPCGQSVTSVSPVAGTHVHRIDHPASLVGDVTTVSPVAGILMAKMAQPTPGVTQYLGLGVYRSTPSYVFTREEFEALCTAAGVEFSGPRFHDSDIGWVK